MNIHNQTALNPVHKDSYNDIQSEGKTIAVNFVLGIGIGLATLVLMGLTCAATITAVKRLQNIDEECPKKKSTQEELLDQAEIVQLSHNIRTVS